MKLEKNGDCFSGRKVALLFTVLQFLVNPDVG